jgi:hypothetical protein
MTTTSLSKIPKTEQRGLFASSSGNDDEVVWQPAGIGVGGFTLALPLLWADTGDPPRYLLSLFGPAPVSVPVGPGTHVQLSEVVAWSKDGGTPEYTINITQNGIAVPGLTSIIVASYNSPVFVPITPVNVDNNDEFNIEMLYNSSGGSHHSIIVTLYLTVSTA